MIKVGMAMEMYSGNIVGDMTRTPWGFGIFSTVVCKIVLRCSIL